MTATTATQRGRAAAERLMVDTATVTRPGGEATFDPNTGALTPADGTVVYTGPCRLRQPSATEADILFGDELVTRTRFLACFPHDAPGFEVLDVVEFTDSDDPEVLTRSFQVRAVPLMTFTIYKAYPVEVVE